MDIYVLFALAGVIIFLGFIGEMVFKKTNVPDVIWLILFGVVLGPILKVVAPGDIEIIAPVFTTFALIFILFEGALSLKFKELFSSMYSSSMLAIIGFFASVIISAGISLAFGFGLIQSIILGAVIGGTSSAVVIPIVKKLKVDKKTATALTIESALSDVLCIVGTVSIIQIYVIGTIQVSNLISGILSSFVVALFIGAVGGYLWLLILRKLSQYTKSYMITIAFMLLVYSFTQFIQSNGAIACLAFGIILGNSGKVLKSVNKKNKVTSAIKEPERFFYAEISFVVKTFFFVYLGILLQFTNALPYIIAAVLVVGLYLVRPIATIVAAKGFSLKGKAVTDSLIPKGLAAAVLAQLPAQAGIPGTQLLADVALAVILISIVTSTILVFLAEKNVYSGLTIKYQAFFSKKPVVVDSKK